MRYFICPSLAETRIWKQTNVKVVMFLTFDLLMFFLIKASVVLFLLTVYPTFAIFQLLTYFAERMISKKTLEKNYVMQVAGGRVK